LAHQSWDDELCLQHLAQEVDICCEAVLCVTQLVTPTNAQSYNVYVISIVGLLHVSALSSSPEDYTEISLKRAAINSLQQKHICCDIDSTSFG
jgi:hypothetical protein